MEIGKKCAGALVAILLFVGCGINERKAKEYAYNNKDKLAEWCLDCFPVKPIEVIRGKVDTVVNEVLRIDTTRVTVKADCPDGTIVNVDCPPEKIVTRVVTTHSTDTVKVVDTALERVLSDTKVRVQIESDRADKWRNYFVMLLGISIAYVLIRR